MPWQRRWSASSTSARVVDPTCQTLVTRLPGTDWCGTRVHTIPLALATSTAATRSTIGASSPTSTSTGCCIGSNLRLARVPCRRGCPRGPVGSQNLTGVLVATVRNPSSRAPAPDSATASSANETTASGGQPRPSFHARAAPRQGQGDSAETECGPGLLTDVAVLPEADALLELLDRLVGVRSEDAVGPRPNDGNRAARATCTARTSSPRMFGSLSLSTRIAGPCPRTWAMRLWVRVRAVTQPSSTCR